MIKGIKPLQVSPVIRCARYILLISGIVYSLMKKRAYKAYESTLVEKRKQLYRDYKENIRKRNLEIEIELVKFLAKEIGAEDPYK